jgi:acetoin utilization protein AcuB
MRDHVVGTHMTRSPHTIGRDQSLAAAHEMMRAHRIRHLPVLGEGKVVGIVSLHDLHFVETLKDVDPKTVLVEEAMTSEAYVVGADAGLDTVATAMAERRMGCAVVVERGAVSGIFTTVDALHALAALVRHRRGPSKGDR